ncbi:uncharacterized protein AB675_7829 [Cyphellophora attinorum]|uniref:F-box domain-containing protein n=1 Tax=Cyphellophora attinorum TaxID=1664694 RepID=A0A0N1H4S0_9EURO|nr:uncharacterized protein AB675_7829 [Phialophora attinorum]KPI40370.1 hypothetical protein AB675_7829 [Phialophora attinorum]
MDNSTAPSLCTLPTEVLHIITSPLKLSDICTLRLCCHACDIRFTPTFTKYLNHQTIELTTRSLNKFLALCSSRFSHHVKVITIEASLWRLDDLEKRLREKQRLPRSPPRSGNFFSRAVPLTEEEIASSQADLEAFKELDRDQAALLRKCHATTLLSRAFRCLGRQFIDIKIRAAVHLDRGEVHLAARGFSWDVEKRMGKRMNATFGAVIVALRASDVLVKRLEVFDFEKGGHVRLDQLYDSWVMTTFEKDRGAGFDNPIVPLALHGLKSLILAISPPPYSNDNGVYQPTAQSGLHKRQLTSLHVLLTACAHSLTHLDVRFRGRNTQHNPESITLFSNLPVLPELSELRLRNTAISTPSLLALLESSPNLTTIGLHRVALCPEFPSSRPPERHDVPPSNPEALVPTILPQFPHPHDSTNLRSWLPVFASLRNLPRLSLVDTSVLSIISHSPTSGEILASPDPDGSNDVKVDLSSWLLSHIFITWPHPATSRIAASDYRHQIYPEGCPDVKLTGDEIRALPRDTLDAAGDISWDEIGVDLHSENSGCTMGDWTPVRYRILKGNPRGSDALYEWRRAVHKEYALF